MDAKLENFDLCDYLAILLDVIAAKAIATGENRAAAIIADDAEAKRSFDALAKAVKDMGGMQIGIVEFGPLEAGAMYRLMVDPGIKTGWPVWQKVA